MSSLLLLTLLSSLLVNLQEVPNEVKDAFEKKFPGVSVISWEKESVTEWEADFKQNKVKYSANFSSDGIWIATEYEISQNDIPKKVIKAFKKAFPDFEIDEAERMESSIGIRYELEIEKGDDEREILFDENGEILSQKEEEDDNDDD